MSKKFYYHKDKFGQEKAYEVFNVQKDAAERLYNMSDNAAFAVEYIHEGDFAGYGSLENYIKEEGADDELIAAVEALNTGCRRVPQLAEKYIFAPEDAVFDFDEFNRQIKLRDILEDAREANG